MALLFVDGFDHYATADILKKWTTGSNANTTIAATGRRGTNAVHFLGINISSNQVTKALGVNAPTLIVGFAVKVTGFAAAAAKVCSFMDAAAYQVWLAFNVDGSISAYTGAATLLGTSAAGVLSIGAFYYVEMKATLHSSAGTVDVRVNNASVLSLTGKNTGGSGNNYANSLRFAGEAAAMPLCDIDDVYCCDTSGSTNNDFLGDVRVDALFPSGDGSQLDFTPSTGTNHSALVDETAPNTSDYNDGTAANQIDLYTFPNLSGNTGTIFGVAVNACVEKDDAGVRTCAPVAKSGSSTGVAASFSPSAGAFLYDQAIFETDPATAAAWAASAVNAAQFGLKVLT